jgi:hypothetical protein
MSTQHGIEENPSGSTGDPWIDAYLRFRRAVLDGATSDELTAFAAELKRDLPAQSPPPPAAMFIHHDIIITCGTSGLSAQLVTALWVPAGVAISGR